MILNTGLKCFEWIKRNKKYSVNKIKINENGVNVTIL